MNELIEKLYKQAHITTETKVRKGGWDNDREPFEYHNVTQTKFDPELFAELIVKECAKWCGHDPSGVDAMLEAFGVKE